MSDYEMLTIVMMFTIIITLVVALINAKKVIAPAKIDYFF